MTRFFRKYHKWIGLFFSFFIIMFAFSGIVLNHRKLFSNIDIPRYLLPKSYRYNNWNNGAIKGSIQLSQDSILIYGGAGIWLTNSTYTSFSDYNKGLKPGTDNKIISNIISTNNNEIYAINSFNVYKLNKADNYWNNIIEKTGIDERICDIATINDTIVIVTRSYIYTSIAPYNQFKKNEFKKPKDYSKKVSLFRTMWLLHSGELFGITGKLFIDSLGILLIILCITGIIFNFWPRIIKHKKKKKLPTKKAVNTMKSFIKWHNKLGAFFLIFFLILSITGMFLCPPLLISIIRSQVNPIPGSILDSENPWHDKLRCLRYDYTFNDWILYSSSGFYKLSNLNSVPIKIKKLHQ